MGVRKRNSAEKLADVRRSLAYAKLNSCPTSPRKMRLVADLIRGVEINKAISVLKYCPKASSITLEKLLYSAVVNWQSKNENDKIEDQNLIVKEVQVNSASSIKRMRPAPQGRGHRIRKRSNHVIITIGNKEEKNTKNTVK
ncbi:50S ribosomal protein L22 [Ichthyobacterium seriolicida]|uniref:Large ribosomal subunit protein uL22 n=1 Tax=Ichthyobacterium seriolicida TaxID=242600 RepID=A0A1J1E1I1_9FLAO|nr:50S ribosomal protein L22 [Ichthyobacterium seriolicida]BAV94813.1 50S ribosomal protein L22 [Ichthyobacterium seriolicida]